MVLSVARPSGGESSPPDSNSRSLTAIDEAQDEPTMPVETGLVGTTTRVTAIRLTAVIFLETAVAEESFQKALFLGSAAV